ncbi:hypothetical protein EIM48_03240 [Pseudoxanthomonas sp. SGNA-20]|uniref:hypothetical protein n=1 Tax=Pseudoxanthomonas sp. SGNA-20 TaxID=2493088 RepID=UPI000F62D6FF|nr:hypothetical protein [Pseudoxanthomonas sp. SGNA-20]RRN59068.1 hypothetical protein EIM48_03240 [Pseudoxanthomonas sp. SGNA-20]
MELDIRIDPTRVDLARIEQALLESDPAALVDLDPASGHLRVATYAGTAEVGAILAAAGVPVPQQAIHIVPSVCCGGCSG